MASMTPLLGNLVDGAAVAVGCCRIEARSEGAPDRLDVAGAGGGEDAVAFAWPRLMPSTCALRARQLLKPYVVGDGSCA